jgi:hypothetical protein
LNLREPVPALVVCDAWGLGNQFSRSAPPSRFPFPIIGLGRGFHAGMFQLAFVAAFPLMTEEVDVAMCVEGPMSEEWVQGQSRERYGEWMVW